MLDLVPEPQIADVTTGFGGRGLRVWAQGLPDQVTDLSSICLGVDVSN